MNKHEKRITTMIACNSISHITALEIAPYLLENSRDAIIQNRAALHNTIGKDAVIMHKSIVLNETSVPFEIASQL